MKQLVIRTVTEKAEIFFILPVIAVKKSDETLEFTFAWMCWFAEIGFRSSRA